MGKEEVKKANGKFGMEVWEDKIKSQGEVGVIRGTNSSLEEINNETSKFMELFDKEIAPMIKNKGKIIDLGVGAMARFSIEFAKRGYSVTGVDISPTTISLANDYIKNAGQDITLIQGDITSLKIKDKQDFIFCYETFFHIPPELTLSSLKIFETLMYDDSLCLVQFGLREKSFLKKIYGIVYWFGHSIKKIFSKTFKVNVSRFSEREIEDLIEESGLYIIKRYSDGIFLIGKVKQ